MAAAGDQQCRGRARFVYVASFGSHRSAGVVRRGPRGRAEPRGAASPESAEQRPASKAPAGLAGAPASSAGSSRQLAGRADLTQEALARKFDFPVPLKEASKIMKKKKKVSAWDSVSKVISRMLEENKKYRLRLKEQQSSGEREPRFCSVKEDWLP